MAETKVVKSTRTPYSANTHAVEVGTKLLQERRLRGGADERRRAVRDEPAVHTLDRDGDLRPSELRQGALPEGRDAVHAAVEQLRLGIVEAGPNLERGDVIHVAGALVAGRNSSQPQSIV